MAREKLLLRIPPDLKSDIVARAAAANVSANQLIIEAIEAYLCRDIKPDSRVIPSEISEAIAELKARVDEIEGRLRRDIPSDSNVIVSQAKASPATDGEIKADGHRWLTTQQAYAVAGIRGYEGSFNAFRAWAKRNPEKLQSLGLVRTGHRGKSNTAASYEDKRL